MKTMKITLLCLALCSLVGCQHQPAETNAEQALQYCSEQVDKALSSLQDGQGKYDFTMEPRNILEGETTWNCRKASEQEWCSGFWPGILWMDYDYLKGKESGVSDEHIDSLRQIAEGYTNALTFLEQQPVFDHDLGFLVINSFLKGYEATGNEAYRRIALAAADTLATLYNNKVGTILSWPRHVKDFGGHNTIMDNMMNLELLYWASENGGSQQLRNIATTHAETTMKHHFRDDGGCYHVAVYDTLDGHFIKGVTHQGYADSSLWARGQSWAIYGYTMVYRYTKDPRFLAHAEKVTDLYLRRLRETSDDWVPIWDMDDPRGTGAPKDASAACVVASALLELSQYVTADKGKTYRHAAEEMLACLNSERYQSRDQNVAFLLHSTGHHPAGSEINASIIYADYYYIEALLRASKKSLPLLGKL